jgi:carbon-monoxide dehydrogenase medium subunit
MRPFDLVEPTTLDEAVTLLGANEAARPIAGGTALLLMVKAGLFQPEALVSLRQLRADLTGIARQDDGSLRIGAMTTLTELGRSPLVRDLFPVITQTLRTLSNVRIRNVATIGGHLAHGDPHMDLPPVLLCLGARLRVHGSQGERWIALDDHRRLVGRLDVGPAVRGHTRAGLGACARAVVRRRRHGVQRRRRCRLHQPWLRG